MNLTTYLDHFCAARQQHDTDARDHSKFRVSDAGKCRLMRYWKRQGKPAEPTFSPEMLRAFHLGIVIHEWIQDVVKNAGIALAIEQQLEDDHRIGHLDALVEIDDKIVLYDVKTINGKKWYYLEKNGFTPDETHYAQLFTYGDMLSRFDLGGVKLVPDDLKILYLNRDTLAVKEVSIGGSALVNESIWGDWQFLIDCWDHQIEPDASPACWECEYCAYKRTCPLKR